MTVGLLAGWTAAAAPVPASTRAPLPTIAVAAAAPVERFQDDPIKVAVQLVGSMGRPCRIQRARIGRAWTDTAQVVLGFRGRARVTVSTVGWNAGRWRLRAVCDGIASAPALVTLATPPPWSEAQVSATGLQPAFDPEITDYVAPCAGGSVDVSVTAAPGLRIGIDRGAAQTGTFTTTVPLTAGQGFGLTLLRAGVQTTASVRCLPEDFPNLTVDGRGTADWYLSSIPFGAQRTDYVFALDSRGTPVWWLKDEGRPNTVRLLDRAEMATFGVDAPQGLVWFRSGNPVVATLDGQRRLQDEWLDRHDLQPTPRGTYYALRYQKRNCATVPADCVDMREYGGGAADTLEDGQVIEIDSAGRVIWRWSTADHVALVESERWIRNRFTGALQDDGTWDIVHLNTVEDAGDAVLITARNLDAILKVDRATGEILWKLGGSTTDRSLQVVGLDGPRPISGPHDARLLPDGTITVFDNGSGAGRVARSLRFRVDEEAGTATVVENVSDPRAELSICCGSTRRMTNGNWITAYGGRQLISEVTPSGEPVFTIFTEPSSWAYRIVPVEPGEVEATAWRSGMDAMHPRR